MDQQDQQGQQDQQDQQDEQDMDQCSMCTSTENTVGLRNFGGSVMTMEDDHIDIDGGGQWSYGWVIRRRSQWDIIIWHDNDDNER